MGKEHICRMSVNIEKDAFRVQKDCILNLVVSDMSEIFQFNINLLPTTDRIVLLNLKYSLDR